MDVIMSFLAGVVDGDGSISKEGRVRVSTGSLEFAKQMTYFLLSIGLKSRYTKTWRKCEKELNGRDCQFDDAWQIVINNPFQIQKYLRSCKKKNLTANSIQRQKTVKITSIDKEQFDGFFYDFTTKKHHNYQGNGIIVSNTFVSGIISAEINNEGIVGVAPKSKIYFVKAIDDSGNGSPVALAQAIMWATKKKVDIISISAGMFVDFNPIKKAIQKAYKNNIIIVAAAGNTGTRHYDVAFPARYPEVIGVAAYNKKHNTAPFSSRGINVSFAMPGVDIYSTWLDNQFIKNSGTSFSAPILSGICALILSKHKSLGSASKTPCETPKQMLEHLNKYAIKLGDDPKETGFGTIDMRSMFANDKTGEEEDDPQSESRPVIRLKSTSKKKSKPSTTRRMTPKIQKRKPQEVSRISFIRRKRSTMSMLSKWRARRNKNI